MEKYKLATNDTTYHDYAPYIIFKNEGCQIT